MHPRSACYDHCKDAGSVCKLQLNREPCRSQVKKCADAGADIVRITVQGKKEAEACMKIREQLFKDG